MVRLGGAVNHILAEAELLCLEGHTRLLQSAPASSDIAVWQFLGPLLLGGCTVIVDHETVCDPAALHALPWSQRPTVAPAGLLQWTSVVCPSAPVPSEPPSFVEPAAPGAPQQSVSVTQSSPPEAMRGRASGDSRVRYRSSNFVRRPSRTRSTSLVLAVSTIPAWSINARIISGVMRARMRAPQAASSAVTFE